MTQEGYTTSYDPIAITLQKFAQYILIGIFGLLPLIFAPSALVPLEYTKTVVVSIGLLTAFLLLSLHVLRTGKMALSVSYTLIAFWVLVLVAWVSALLSGDPNDSFVGDVLGVHTFCFLGLLALTASLWSYVGIDRGVVTKLYLLLGFSTVALAVLHMVRLFGGPDVLNFGILSDNTSTVIGNWNELALFFGLVVLLTLLTLEQIKLNKYYRYAFAALLVVSLVMLSVINFFSIWLILGLISFGMIVYSLSKDRFSGIQRPLIKQRESSSSLILSLIVCAVSLFFIIGGGALGTKITTMTGISYVEVRPSLEATIGIMKGVYTQDALLGVGPNRFADAWRTHKNEAINDTIFWNTDFNAGNGYIPTFFVTTGILGAIAWTVFLGTFLWFGIRGLLRYTGNDPFWHYVKLSSFVGALYVWIISMIYVPGTTMILIGALCTGITIAADRALKLERIFVWDMAAAQRVGFIVTMGVIGMMIFAVQLLFISGKQYVAAYTFNSGILLSQSSNDVHAVEARLLSAYELRQSDVYARRVSDYQFSQLSGLLALKDPTEEQKKQFEDVFKNAISAAVLSTELDPTEPINWATLGGIYSLLVTANYEGAYDRAHESLSMAKSLDPHNPARSLALAELEARGGKNEPARTFANESISKKANYGDAFLFLSQLDIAEGNVEGAIRHTEAVIALEPNNAARYYQLGVLNTALGRTEKAVAAFEGAIRTDPSYANARYLLAFAYDALGRTEEARQQLVRVLELNPGNRDVEELIALLDQDGSFRGLSSVDAVPVLNESVVDVENDTVITTEDPDSSLVSPVNVVPEELEDTEE